MVGAGGLAQSMVRAAQIGRTRGWRREGPGPGERDPALGSGTPDCQRRAARSVPASGDQSPESADGAEKPEAGDGAE